MRASGAPVFDDLGALAAHVAGSGARSVVLANGCFDPLHVGHVRYLEDAKRHGDYLVVAVNDDAGARRLKGPGRPVVRAAERARLVGAIAAVDAVLVFGDESVTPVLERLLPSVHAKGTDYTPDSVPEADTAKRLGIRTLIAGDPKSHASRDIVSRVRAALTRDAPP